MKENRKVMPESITLSIYNSDAGAFGVTWITEEKGIPLLEYTLENDINYENSVIKIGKTDNMNDGTYYNYALIDNVTRGEKYRWRVGDKSGVFSSDAIFIVPNFDKKTMFTAITDTQDSSGSGSYFRAALKNALENFPDLQFILHGGDIVDNGKERHLWKQMLGDCEEYVRSIPMAAISGNHDYWWDENTLRHHFYIEAPKQDTKYGTYYSFDVGDVHITCLSSGDCMETNENGLCNSQLSWIEEDISKTDKRWKIVLMHNPMFSPGKYGSRDGRNAQALSQRKQLSRMFAKKGVDLVLCGHDHSFGITYPVNENDEPIINTRYEEKDKVKYLINPEGTVHFEMGCGGNQARPVEEPFPEKYSRYFETYYNMPWEKTAYSIIETENNTLKITINIVNPENAQTESIKTFAIKKIPIRS